MSARFFQTNNNSCDILFFHSGKTVKKEPGNEEGQQHFDDADKLLQEFQEAQVDRVGSRPSSNLSSLSNSSERDQHHLGTCGLSRRTHGGSCKNVFPLFFPILYSNMEASLSTGSPAHLGNQSEMVHDPYEFLQSPEAEGTANN